MVISNLYARLGLARTATQADIKNAYYKLSKLYHPDKNEGCKNAALKFREITEAYEVLGNPKTRKEYDHKESPFDNRRRNEKNTPRSKPQRTYEYASVFSERDPEYEAKIRFYRQFWQQKAKRPQYTYRPTNPYDFDSWLRAHYGDTSKSGWYGKSNGSTNTTNLNEYDYDTFGEFLRRDFNRKDSDVKPPEEAPKRSSPFDFEHIYRNPIEYTKRRQSMQKTDVALANAALVMMGLVLVIALTTIIENADENEESEDNKNRRIK